MTISQKGLITDAQKLEHKKWEGSETDLKYIKKELKRSQHSNVANMHAEAVKL